VVQDELRSNLISIGLLRCEPTVIRVDQVGSSLALPSLMNDFTAPEVPDVGILATTMKGSD
jgi:hypothetical protein